MKFFCLIILLFSTLQTFSAEIECLKVSDSTTDLLHCKTKLKNYPELVHFYIPKHLDLKLPLQLFTHFHGHNLKGYDHFSKTYGDYGLFLLKSKANAVLVIPESHGHCETYDKFFSDKKRAIQFYSEVESVIERKTLMNITTVALSGHSGAYRVLNRLIGYANSEDETFSKISALGLFDATYGVIPEIEKWVKNKSDSNEHFLFYDTFVSGNMATTEENSLILKKHFQNLTLENIFFIPVSGHDAESLLDQHFNILKRGSLTRFWTKASAL